MIFDDTSDRPAVLPAASPRDACSQLALDATVNDVLRRFPNAGQVFNAFGVDTCCGGGNTLVEAARAADLDPAVLLDALEVTVCPALDAAAVNAARTNAVEHPR